MPDGIFDAVVAYGADVTGAVIRTGDLRHAPAQAHRGRMLRWREIGPAVVAPVGPGCWSVPWREDAGQGDAEVHGEVGLDIAVRLAAARAAEHVRVHGSG